MALDPISNHPQAHMFESLCAFRRQDVAASIVLEQAKKGPTTQCPPSRVQSDQSPGQRLSIRPNPGNSHNSNRSLFHIHGEARSRQIQIEPVLIGIGGWFGCDLRAFSRPDHHDWQDPSREEGPQRKDHRGDAHEFQEITQTANPLVTARREAREWDHD